MQEINGRTFFPKIECEWCGANDFTYEQCGPHIKAYCNTCGHSTFVKQINDIGFGGLTSKYRRTK